MALLFDHLRSQVGITPAETFRSIFTSFDIFPRQAEISQQYVTLTVHQHIIRL